MANDLSDVTTELTIARRKLKESQSEVERMKSQLREYVQEIQRAEELLMNKVLSLKYNLTKRDKKH